MRFKTRKRKLGEVFIFKTFAWLPICLDGECRWLENVSIEAHYYKGALGIVDISYHRFVD